MVKPGATLGDIGAAVQKVVEAEGFSVVRDFVGHGIGVHMHEDPQVPNFGEAGRGMKLRAGMVIAIEPMVNAGEAGCPGARRWLDGSDRRWKHECSFRAHGGGHRHRGEDFDRVALALERRFVAGTTFSCPE